MYTITDAQVVRTIESYCRTWRIFLTDADTGAAWFGESVMAADSSVQSVTGDDIELGAVCSGSWSMTVHDPAKTDFLGKRLKVAFYLKDFAGGPMTWEDLRNYTCAQLSRLTAVQIRTLKEIMGGQTIPMGEFTAVRSKRSGGMVELTLYDKLYFSDKAYTPSVRLPAMASDIENDICTQLGIENGNVFTESALLRDSRVARLKDSGGLRLRVQGFDFTVNSIAGGTTMRQMLGYFAGAMGQFGCIDRFGKYRRKWYGDPVKTLDPNTIDLPTISERPNTVTQVICHVSDSVTYASSWGEDGRTIEFDCPYMTQVLFDSLCRRLQKAGLTWYTAEVDHRLGDPRFDLGDVLGYDDGEPKKIPITGLDYSYDGGLSAAVKAVGRSVEEEI